MDKYEPLTGADQASCPACIGAPAAHAPGCNVAAKKAELLDDSTVEQMEDSQR